MGVVPKVSCWNVFLSAAYTLLDKTFDSHVSHSKLNLKGFYLEPYQDAIITTKHEGTRSIGSAVD